MERTASPDNMSRSSTTAVYPSASPSTRHTSTIQYPYSPKIYTSSPTLRMSFNRQPLSPTPNVRTQLPEDILLRTTPVAFVGRGELTRRTRDHGAEEPSSHRRLRRRGSSQSSDDSGEDWPWAKEYSERYPPQEIGTLNELDRRYPPDRFGEEATDNARVWKIYRDRAEEQDEDLLRGWNKTLDILLIFAGLFSAVLTAFVVESYKELQPDYSKILAKAVVTALNPNSSAPPTEFDSQVEGFKSPTNARWVNGLWLSSLVLSLGVALLAILVRQWLDDYTSRMRRPVASLRRWAWRHILYSDALTQWGIGALVSALPFMLHVSVFLFFAGLVVQLRDNDEVIVAVVGTLVGLVVGFYIVATLLPLAYGTCPSVTPLLRLAHDGFARLNASIQRLIHPDTQKMGDEYNKPAPFDETRLIASKNFDVRVLKTMITTLPSEEDANIALDAIGCLNAKCKECRDEGLWDSSIQELAVSRIRAIGTSSSSIPAAARSLRTILFLRAYEGQLSDSTRQQLLAICGRLHKIKKFDLFLLSATLASRLMNDDQARLLAHIKPLLDWPKSLAHDRDETSAPLHPTTLSVMLNPGEKWELRSLLDLLDFTSWSATSSATSITLSQGETALKQIMELVLRYLQQDIQTRCDSVEAQKMFQSLVALFEEGSDMAIFVPQFWIFVQTYQSKLVFLREFDENAPFGTAGPIRPAEMRLNLNAQLLRATSLLARSERCLQSTLSLDQLLQSFDTELVFTEPWDRRISLGCGELLVNAGKHDSTHWSSTLHRLTRHIIQNVTNDDSSSLELICDLVEAIAPPERCKPSSRVLQTFASPEEAINNTRLNLLLQLGGWTGGSTVSTWRLISNVLSRDAAGRPVLSILASHLVGLMISLSRFGFDVSGLFHELMGNGQGVDLIREAPLSPMKWDLALHGREISERCAPRWWAETRTALLSHPNNWSGDDVFNRPENFVTDLESASNCHLCPEGGIVFAGTWRSPVRSRDGKRSIPLRSPAPALVHLPEVPEDIGMPIEALSRVPTLQRRPGSASSQNKISLPRGRRLPDPSDNV